VLWFFWKGRNWARLCVLAISFVSVINLFSLIYPHGIVVVYDAIVVAWAVLGDTTDTEQRRNAIRESAEQKINQLTPTKP
jgi:hypothetical protein